MQGTEVQTVPCTIYTSVSAHSATIEIVPCASCPKNPHAFAGPDLGELGIFNMNNNTLYTHELLNEFSNRYTAAETLFDAFCTTLRHTYIERGINQCFLCKKTFELAWMAFHRVQKLGAGFSCPECGKYPKRIVVDGVTTGYCAKFKTCMLCPPTVPTEDSISREGIVPVTNTSIVPGNLRKSALALVKW